MQKHVNLVDLVKSFPTNIYLQNLASIQKRTRPIKFAHLAEKSEKASISNLSTKATRAARHVAAGTEYGEVARELGLNLSLDAIRALDSLRALRACTLVERAAANVGTEDPSVFVIEEVLVIQRRDEWWRNSGTPIIP